VNTHEPRGQANKLLPVHRYDKSKGLVLNAAGNVEHVTRGGVVNFPASLPTDVRLLNDGRPPIFMWGLSTTAPFLQTVESVLSFAYPGKFKTHEDWNRPGWNSVHKMTSNKLYYCDDEMKASVRALKANMHAAPSLAELAHECVVVNGLAAALEGLELPTPQRLSEL
jgi:hypothetical protein